MLGDHLWRRHLGPDSNPLPLELLLGFRVDILGTFALMILLLHSVRSSLIAVLSAALVLDRRCLPVSSLSLIA